MRLFVYGGFAMSMIRCSADLHYYDPQKIRNARIAGK